MTSETFFSEGSKVLLESLLKKAKNKRVLSCVSFVGDFKDTWFPALALFLNSSTSGHFTFASIFLLQTYC